jgi:hypothetical protein
MMFCSHCGATVREAGHYCSICGTRVGAPEPGPLARIQTVNSGRPRAAEEPTVSRGFGQMFGIDPRIAVVMLVLDAMLNAGEIASMGLLVPVSLAAGVVLGYVTYRAQRKWYGDDKESAKIKALIVGLLTAIPTPLPEILYLPFGIVGFFHNLRRKKIGDAYSPSV